jgi:hypothetical protein
MEEKFKIYISYEENTRVLSAEIDRLNVIVE